MLTTHGGGPHSLLPWVLGGSLGAVLADRAALTNQKLEQNRRKLFPKPVRLLSGAGLCPVPGPGLALQVVGASPVTPTRSPSSPRPLPRGPEAACCVPLCPRAGPS